MKINLKLNKDKGLFTADFEKQQNTSIIILNDYIQFTQFNNILTHQLIYYIHWQARNIYFTNIREYFSQSGNRSQADFYTKKFITGIYAIENNKWVLIES